jgi:hypothetical protein
MPNLPALHRVCSAIGADYEESPKSVDGLFEMHWTHSDVVTRVVVTGIRPAVGVRYLSVSSPRILTGNMVAHWCGKLLAPLEQTMQTAEDSGRSDSGRYVSFARLHFIKGLRSWTHTLKAMIR